MDQQDRQDEEEGKHKIFLNNLKIQTEGSELEEAEKFDDVVFQYQRDRNENYKLRLVQVKHVKSKICGKDNILKSDLLSKSDQNNYSIQKYFHSYVNIKNRCLERSKYSIFSGSEIDDLIIATNIDFDSDIIDCFEKLEFDKDDILKLSDDLTNINPKAAIYMFKNIESNDIVENIKPILRETSDFRKLINELADCEFQQKPIGKTELFIDYYYALTKNVFSIEPDNSAGNEHQITRKVKFCAKFLPKFIEKNYDSNDEEALQFRNALIREIILRKEKIDIKINKLPAEDIRKILENVKFNVSNNLAKEFEPPTNPQIIDVQIFVNELKVILDKSDANIIQISETDDETEFMNNFRKLAGYVLVTKFNKIRFSTYFLDMEELPGNLNNFRFYLKELLGDEKFNSLYEYEFEINGKIFKTCEEGALHRKLPILCTETQIQEFLKKFKFVLNYPNAEDIDNMIGKEMEVLYKTLNIDGSKSIYIHKLYKWLKDNKANFYTVDNTRKLFDDINREMFISKIDGSSKSYIDNAFNDFKFNIYECIPDFLCNKQQQILDLTFKDLDVARAKIVQTIQYLNTNNENADINKYILESGQIFTNLSQLEDDVVNYFNDSKRGNLLVIECDKENKLSKTEQLLNILKEYNHKKIIFIRHADFLLSKRFTEFNYIAKEDKTNFSDLTEDTQKKLLEKEIIFQGQKITLKKLLAGNSNSLEDSNLQIISTMLSKFIDAEVLSELMKNNNIKIDSNKSANLDDMKEYFIDRNYDLYQKIELDKECIDKNDSDLFVTNYDNKNEEQDFPGVDYDIINNFQSNNYLNFLIVFETHRRKQSFVSSSLIFNNQLINYKYKHPNENQEQIFVLSNFVSQKYSTEYKYESIILDYFLYYLDLMNQNTDGYLNVHFIFDILDVNKFFENILYSITQTHDRDIDDIFYRYDKGQNYRLNLSQTSQMFDYLCEYSEPYKLAKALIKCILKKLDYEDHKILTRFFWQLNKEIIDITNKKFHYNFIHNISLSDVAANFRKTFLCIFKKLIIKSLLPIAQERFLVEFLKKVREVNISEDDIWKEIEKIQLNNLPNVFNLLNSNPEFIDLNTFTEKFIELLNTGTVDKNIKIDTTTLGPDIHNLAINVLVADNFYDKRLKFNSIVFDDNIKFPNNIEQFRNLLKEKFQRSDNSFNDLMDYKFEIEDFETCMDNDHSLPKELIEEFLKKIIFRQSALFNNKLDDSWHRIKKYIEKRFRYEIYKYDITQSYLLMFFLNKIKEFNFNKFCLGTALFNSKKFNDVIFKYSDREGQIRYLFIQIQLLDECKKMNFDYLFRSNFRLQDLFLSYLKIILTDQLKDGLKKFFFIYTDSNFDTKDLKLYNIQLQKVNIIDDMGMDDVGKDIELTEFYRLVIDKYHTIIEELMEESASYRMSKKILFFICSERVIKIELLPLGLTMEVIDIENKTLRYNFVHNKSVSIEAKKLRECFIYAYRLIYAEPNTREDIIFEELQKIELKLDPEFQTLLENPTFHFINDVILKHENIIKICNPKLDDDNKILTCTVEILDNNTKLKVIKSYDILLTSFDEMIKDMNLEFDFHEFCRNILSPNYLSKFVEQKQNSLCTIRFSDDFSDKDLMNFFRDLIFIQHPPEFQVYIFVYSSVECFKFKFPNSKLPISDIKYIDDLNTLFYNKVTPGLRWLHQEDISSTKPIRTILAPNLTLKELEQLFETYPNHTIHCLKRENNKFIWLSSRGTLINLRKFITKNENIFKSSNIEDRIVIIAAEPGMGKSTILKYLAQNIKNSHPYKWVIKLDLNNCEKQLEQVGQFDTIDKIINFIYSAAKLQTLLEHKFLLFQIEEHGKIILLFDGLDEIVDKNREKVITLLKALKKYKIEKLWITTRLHLRNIIEDELSIFSYELKPFEDKDQTNFLKKFWMNKFNLNHNSESEAEFEVIHEYIRNLIDSFKNDTSKNDRDFLGIPLQSKMLAEAFQENFWEFYNASLQNQQIEFNFPKKNNLLNLYRKFIDTKYKIYFNEKNLSPRKKTEEILLTRSYTKFHRSIAFELLLPTEINFLKKCDITPDCQDILIQIGIVQSKNVELNFVHRTFAEYFVADQLSYFMQKDENNAKYIKTIEFLRDVFFKDGWNVVIKFCDRMLTESHPTLDATLNNDEKFFENNEFDINILDILGRNALHLAATYNNVAIINLLVKETIDVNIYDSIFGWTPIVYAVQYHNWDIAELLLKAGANPVDIKKVKNVKSVDENGMTLLHFAARFTNDDIITSILERGVDINVSDKNGLTPMFYAIKADNLSIMKCLIKAKADYKFVNKERLNPISYAKKLNKNDIVQYLEQISRR